VATPPPTDIFGDVLSATQSPEKAAVLAELHGSISRLVPVVYQHVQKYLTDNAKDALYLPKTFDQDLKDHLPALLGAVPPIESGTLDAGKTPTDFASILNVGWAVLLSKLSNFKVKPSSQDPFG
jgi:hypothetical protein